MHQDPKITRPKQTSTESSVENKTVAPSSLKPVQRNPLNISESEEVSVRERALTTSGKEAETPTVAGRGPGLSDEALVSKDSPSMASDPAFEKAAIQWEDKFGGVAYNDPRATAVVDEAAAKAVAYLKEKSGEWEATNEGLKVELGKIGIKDAGWSGGVGVEVQAIMDALTTGPLGVKIAHFENFVNGVFAKDLVSVDTDTLDSLLAAADVERTEEFNTTMTTMRDTKNPWGLTSPKGVAADQWHQRATRFPGEKQKERSTRTSKDLEAIGVNVSDAEKKHMGSTEPESTLAWEEGARVWAMNEKDKWVHAMRELSLPLAAGVSGTTARMMQNLSTFGVGNAADNRLACIGYLLPTHHHSLVEIMAGANDNGGPSFTPSKKMYRDIAPYTENELRSRVGPFPDEVSSTESK